MDGVDAVDGWSAIEWMQLIEVKERINAWLWNGCNGWIAWMSGWTWRGRVREAEGEGRKERDRLFKTRTHMTSHGRNNVQSINILLGVSLFLVHAPRISKMKRKSANFPWNVFMSNREVMEIH